MNKKEPQMPKDYSILLGVGVFLSYFVIAVVLRFLGFNLPSDFPAYFVNGAIVAFVLGKIFYNKRWKQYTKELDRIYEENAAARGKRVSQAASNRTSASYAPQYKSAYNTANSYVDEAEEYEEMLRQEEEYEEMLRQEEEEKWRQIEEEDEEYREELERQIRESWERRRH